MYERIQHLIIRVHEGVILPQSSHVVPYFGDFVCRTTAFDPLLPWPISHAMWKSVRIPITLQCQIEDSECTPRYDAFQRLSGQTDQHGYPGRFSHGQKQTFPPMIRPTLLASLHCDHRTGNLDCSGQLNFLLRFRIRIVLTNGEFLEGCIILQVKVG